MCVCLSELIKKKIDKSNNAYIFSIPASKAVPEGMCCRANLVFFGFTGDFCKGKKITF